LAAGAFVLVKGGVASPECSTQAETRLAGFPTILGAGHPNLRAPRITSGLTIAVKEIGFVSQKRRRCGSLRCALAAFEGACLSAAAVRANVFGGI